MVMSERVMLHTSPAKQLGPQVFVGERPDRTRITQVSNRPFWRKPMGGLWTSSLSGTTGSAWIDWCRLETYGNPDASEWWSLIPAGDAPLLVVDCVDDLVSLHDAFPGTSATLDGFFGEVMGHIDFEAMLSAGYAGIHLTGFGQETTKYAHGGNNLAAIGLDLYGWDCESTVWFTWCFDDDPVLRHEGRLS